MKFGFKMEAVLHTLGSIFALLLQVIALASHALLFVANIAALTFMTLTACLMLFVFYKASGDSLVLPFVLVLAGAGVMGYEIYDRRHRWQPVNVNQ